MRIAHLLGWYFPESVGGTEVYVRELCRLLRAAGHGVAIAAPRAGLPGAITYEVDSVPVFRYPVPATPTRDEVHGLRAARGTEQLVAWLSDHRFDVVHAHSIVTGLGVRELEAARLFGSRIVVTHHLPSLGYLCRAGTLMERAQTSCDGVVSGPRCAECYCMHLGVPAPIARAVAHVPPALSRLSRNVPGRFATAAGVVETIALGQQLQARLFTVADAQVALNEVSRRMFSANRLPMDRVTLNRLGISGGPYARKPLRPTSRPVRFGYVGRLDRYKGLTELVAAVKRVPRDIDLVLEIRARIADDVDRHGAAELSALAADDRRIAIGPGPSRAEVGSVLAGFDVLCCVSTGFENGPTVALEAMAVGTPVLGSSLGNLPEIVADGINGRLVAPADVDALATALADIARHPGQIDRWRQHEQSVRTMSDVAADYASLYTRLLQPPASRCAGSAF